MAKSTWSGARTPESEAGLWHLLAVTLNDLCSFGRPQFPLLQHGDSSSVSRRWLWGFQARAQRRPAWAPRLYALPCLRCRRTRILRSSVLHVCCNSGSLPVFIFFTNIFLNLFSNSVIFFEVQNLSAANRCPSPFWYLPLLWNKSYILTLFFSVFI